MPVKRTRLAARRKAVGFSQEKLAECLQVDRSTVARWESGEVVPQPWKRDEIAKALRVSVEQLDEFLTEESPVVAGFEGKGGHSQISDGKRLCGACGLPLSRYNSGGLCQSCVNDKKKEQPIESCEVFIGSNKLAELRRNRNMTQELLAERAGISASLVQKIEQGSKKSASLRSLGAIARVLSVRLDALLEGSSPEIPANDEAHESSEITTTRRTCINPLINRHKWTRDDLSELSSNFDNAISSSDASDIEILAHAWLSAENPQLIELNAGRRIGDSLVSTAEHRVIQLRRADDYVSGHTTYELVREEIRATTRLLNDASLNEDQARRLLTATGELAQLAAWIAADMGQYQEAESYVQNGVIASHAASNHPLAANIISTLSYQLANTGKPRQASIFARTAYAGARHTASATTKALLLERIAWADAKLGDLNSCDRSLGLVNENFSKSAPEDDPDWVYWLSREEIDVMAGRCFTELGQPEKAIPLLRSSIERYDSTHIREISLYQSWLAEDYILLGDIRTAADLAIEVLELGSRANSARTDERLRHLAASLREYKGIQNVTEFLDQHKAYLQR